MRTAKQDELAEKHGTPEQFEKAIWKAYSDLFISHEEATSAIRRYQTEWDDAATGYAANAPAEARVLPSPPAGCSAWIAVRDRFPDDARDVLTFGRYGVHKACFEWGTEDDPCWWTDEVRKADFKESVTHWAELPNAKAEGAK